MIYNKIWNHRSIINSGQGASEFQFYMLAFNLSKNNNVSIFSNHPEEKIDNIEYRKYEDVFNKNKVKLDSIVIINRFYNLVLKIPNFKKVIIWAHDWNPYLTIKENKYEILKKLKKVEIVCVSKTHQEHIKTILNFNKNVKFIYNSLYPEYFEKNKGIEYNKNKFIFASSFAKGLKFILKIFDKYYEKNKEIELILIKPSYCKNDYNQRSYITYLDNIKCKKELSKLLQTCLCLIGSRFRETFGCIFAEAYHLGVPVIGDNSLPSAVKEIINNDHICNFNNPLEVIQKIEEFRENRPIVSLDKIFYQDNIINQWGLFCNA